MLVYAAVTYSSGYQRAGPAAINSTTSPQPQPAVPPAPPPSASTQSGSNGAATLNVVVPADAKVTVNGHETKTPGSQRQYVSYGLQSNREYLFKVAVQVTRGGKVQQETRSAILGAGGTATLTFNLGESTQQLAAN